MTDTIPETARLTADVVLLADHDHVIHVLLIRRGWDPYKDHWALPGGHVDTGEDTEGAARRELEEETGLAGGREFHLVGVYAEPGRDPRGRYATFAYVTWTTGLPQPTAADDAAEARWMPVDELLAGDTPLAFDHRRIISDAMRRLF
jgi:8-oxo-dGTP diphosphatase